MVGAERVLADTDRLDKERLGLGKAARIPKQTG
jgi:hypothetical protein